MSMSVLASENVTDESLSQDLQEHYQQLRLAAHFHQHLLLEDLLCELLQQLQRDEGIMGLQYELHRGSCAQQINLGQSGAHQLDFQLSFSGESLGRLVLCLASPVSSEWLAEFEELLMALALPLRNAVSFTRLQEQLAGRKSAEKLVERS